MPRKWRQGQHKWYFWNYTFEVWAWPTYYPLGLMVELSLFRQHQAFWLTLGRLVFYLHSDRRDRYD